MTCRDYIRYMYGQEFCSCVDRLKNPFRLGVMGACILESLLLRKDGYCGQEGIMAWLCLVAGQECFDNCLKELYAWSGKDDQALKRLLNRIEKLPAFKESPFRVLASIFTICMMGLDAPFGKAYEFVQRAAECHKFILSGSQN